MSSQRVVHLSTEETEFLRRGSFLSDDLRLAIENAEIRADGRCILVVPEAMAESFRTAFTEQLARVGFDVDYKVTSEGSMLEDLIDRFA